MAIAKHIANRYPLFNRLRSLLVWILLFYLRVFAKITLKLSTATTIGIAGAVGKSTTRNALSSILTPIASTCVVEGNSETGIPLGIFNLDPGSYSLIDWIRIVILVPTRIFRLRTFKYIIIEMGIDGPNPPKNMQYLLTIVKPQIGILLSESPAHIEQYEAIIPSSIIEKEEQIDYIVTKMIEDDGKLLLTSTCKSAFVDATDEKVYEFAKKHIKNSRLYTIGSTIEHDIVIHHHETTLDGTTFGFSLHSHQQKEYITLTFPGFSFPIQSGTSLGAAIITSVHLGIPIDDIQKNLSTTFIPPPGRCTLLKGKNGNTIIDSSYNASPDSIISFLNVLKSLKQQDKKSTVMIFGDMKEMGSYSQIEHIRTARQLINVVDHLILIGPLTKQYVLPYLEKHVSKFRSIVSFSSIREAQSYVESHIPKDAIVLVKGSQNLEELIKLMLDTIEDNKLLCRQDSYWEQNKRSRNIWID